MLFLYAIPSFFAFFFKLFLIVLHLRKDISRTNFWFLSFLFGLLGMNLFEFFSFFYVSQANSALLILSFYYLFVEITVFSFLFLSLSITNNIKVFITLPLIVLFFLSIVLIFLPDAAIVGVKSIGYSITRVAGPHYGVLQFLILAPLASAMAILFGYSTLGSKVVKRKARVLLLASLPLVLTVVCVMILMNLGYQINASVILSTMVVFTILILINAERQEDSFQLIDRAYAYKITSLFPNSRDHRFVKKMTALVANPEMGLARGRELIEQEMIREALLAADGNKSQAAEMLGISRQTLMRKISE